MQVTTVMYLKGIKFSDKPLISNIQFLLTGQALIYLGNEGNMIEI